ncbi:hypothetical protein LIER_01931 [Lithospermum erythrorhizon]|uniref:Integrase zinc-binding domain-containing protein n=1 Tax=Lithospermum erythrorhizon TaxID=34254 RepID=A0AAV3NP73_LITER
MIQDELYKQSYIGPFLYCVSEAKIDQTLYEVHEGHVCGHHIGGHSSTLKVTRAGYYWPTIMKDAAEYVKRCDVCQRMQPIPRHLVAEMSPVGSQPKNQNKLNPKWECPYWIRRIIGPGTYELEELPGKTIDHTWHRIYLKKYYA